MNRHILKYLAAAALAVVLLAGILLLLPAMKKSTKGTALEVYCFQAGKADAFLLTTPESTVLIDCGEKGFGQTILEELARRGLDHIDVLIVTHFDQDHVGGAAKIINNMEIGTVLQSNSPKDSDEYEKYVKALGNAGLAPVTVRETLEFALDGVQYSVDPPRQESYETDPSNNSSLIVTVENGENILLFMGDAETERVQEYLEAGAAVDCDVLKIPHHGGKDELIPALIEATAPEYAVITCSDEDTEAKSTARALQNAAVETYLTRLGAVIIRSDGKDLTLSYAEESADNQS